MTLFLFLLTKLCRETLYPHDSQFFVYWVVVVVVVVTITLVSWYPEGPQAFGTCGWKLS